MVVRRVTSKGMLVFLLVLGGCAFPIKSVGDGIVFNYNKTISDIYCEIIDAWNEDTNLLAQWEVKTTITHQKYYEADMNFNSTASIADGKLLKLPKASVGHENDATYSTASGLGIVLVNDTSKMKAGEPEALTEFQNRCKTERRYANLLALDISRQFKNFLRGYDENTVSTPAPIDGRLIATNLNYKQNVLVKGSVDPDFQVTLLPWKKALDGYWHASDKAIIDIVVIRSLYSAPVRKPALVKIDNVDELANAIAAAVSGRTISGTETTKQSGAAKSAPQPRFQTLTRGDEVETDRKLDELLDERDLRRLLDLE